VKGSLALASCGLAMLVGAAPALAAGQRYEGLTSQEQTMNLHANERGAATRAFLFWRADCRHGRGFRNSTAFRAPLDRSSPNRFHDRRHYTAKQGKLKARYEAEIDGVRKSPRRFRGTFELTVRFFDDGVKYETCRVRDVRWSLTRVAR